MFTLSRTEDYTHFMQALTVQKFKKKFPHLLISFFSFFFTEEEQSFSLKKMYLYTCTYIQLDSFDDSNDIGLERESDCSRPNCLNCCSKNHDF